jgi:hypothetical protein
MSLKRNNIVQVLQKHPNGEFDRYRSTGVVCFLFFIQGWWFVQFGDQTGFVPGSYLEPSELKRGAREGKIIEKSLSNTHEDFIKKNLFAFSYR